MDLLSTLWLCLDLFGPIGFIWIYLVLLGLLWFNFGHINIFIRSLVFQQMVVVRLYVLDQILLLVVSMMIYGGGTERSGRTVQGFPSWG